MEKNFGAPSDLCQTGRGESVYCVHTVITNQQQESDVSEDHRLDLDSQSLWLLLVSIEGRLT
jgi:hypothetical protein